MKVYKGIDVLKIFAALGIVAIHSNLILFKTLGRLGVPFFAIISSFFFFKKYLILDKDGKRNRLILFEKRILYLFLCWEVFYIPLALKNFIYLVKINGLTLKTILKYIFYFFLAPANAINGWGLSWYLIAMIIGLPIFIMILKLFKNSLLITFAIFLIIEIYFICSSEFNFCTHFSQIGVHGFPRLLIYIFLGYIIAKFLKRFSRSKIFYFNLMLIMLAIFLIENFFIWKMGGLSNSQEVITTVPTSFSIALFSIKYQPNISSTSVLRQFSTFLYCVQAWPMWILGHFLNTASIVDQLAEFICIVVFALVCFQFYRLIKSKTKWQFWSYMV